MSITERSRRRVADALDRLEADYDEFEVVEKTWEQSPEIYERTRERFEDGTLGGAGAWVRNDDGEVAFVRHEAESAWSDPGGKQEPGESLEATAWRETREEAGIEIELAGVRQAHRIEIRDERHEEPPVHRLIVIFDAEYVSGELRPREDEIAEVRWWDERPDDLLYADLEEYPIPAAE